MNMFVNNLTLAGKGRNNHYEKCVRYIWWFYW